MVVAAAVIVVIAFVATYQPLADSGTEAGAWTAIGGPGVVIRTTPARSVRDFLGNRVPRRTGLGRALAPASTYRPRMFVAPDWRETRFDLAGDGFTAPAHGYRSVIVTVRVWSCPGGTSADVRHSLEIVEGLRLRYRFAWFSHTAMVKLHETAYSHVVDMHILY